jgi:hypothetical protein
MKKLVIFISLSLFLLSSIETKAQMATKGVKGGLNVSNILLEGTEYNFLEGFHAGAFFRTAPIEKVSLQVEIMYSQMGAELDVEQSFSSYSGGTIRLNYITVPVMARINFADNKFGILVGPGINYLAAVADDGDLDGSGKDLRALYKNFDFTVSFGFEVDITSGIIIGSRTSLGISDIMSGDNVLVDGPFGIPIPYTTVTGGVSNFVVQGYLGLIF